MSDTATGSSRDARTPIVLAWSGGKDSSLALAALEASGDYAVVALLTTVTADYDRVSMHGVRRCVLEAQVAAIGLPLHVMTMPAASADVAYEAAFSAALEHVRDRHPGLAHVAFGDLHLADVRAYREALCARAGWTAVYPLWGLDTGSLARDFIARGFRAVLACVDTTQVAGALAGADYDATLLAALPATADPCGENGEFHTLVLDGPIFAHPIAVTRGERVLRDGRFEYCDFVLERR